MGTGEESSPAKNSKSTSNQETPPPSYPDWSSSMQAYYGSGVAPPFFASTVASPTPHPYAWGGQHPMMAPYGTPVPYAAMYPPAGVYGHPGMPMTPGTVQPTTEMESKAPNGKDKVNKKSKGSSGNVNAAVLRLERVGRRLQVQGMTVAPKVLKVEIMVHLMQAMRITSRIILEAKREASIRCLQMRTHETTILDQMFRCQCLEIP
ncbi:putative G-box binding protein, multifunctional mosaic region [Helianthus annuus]|nr:putative G-box binding protein, multifunctional mosaic region [Helianthus annuus]